MEKFLGKYTISTLNQVGLLCGLKSGTTKQTRIDQIISGLNIYNHIKTNCDETKLNVLSIDIGVKNFAYCQINKLDLTGTKILGIKKWNKLNLNEKYPYEPLMDESTIYDKKVHINHLANEITKKLLTNKPDIVVMEVQRTKSNNNSVTLQTVLLNFTLENLIYHQLWQAGKIVVPMTSAQMINFWLNRFVTKECLSGNKNAKTFRNQIVLDWLNGAGTSLIKNTFTDGEVTKSSLLAALDLPVKNNKIDDLIDSMLYNLTLIQQLRNQRVLQQYLLEERDLNEFVDKYNRVQLDLIEPLITNNDLQLLDEFLKLDKYYVEPEPKPRKTRKKPHIADLKKK